MVSADNLNLDVLELIFCFLSGNDLPSVALVSRSFLAGVIPRLYDSISYRIRQMKGYDSVGPYFVHPLSSECTNDRLDTIARNQVAIRSPNRPPPPCNSRPQHRCIRLLFSTGAVEQIHIVNHISPHIEIRAVVTVMKSHLNPNFVRETKLALALCKNLQTFWCTIPNILPMIFPSLQDKERLESMRINAHLTTEQSKTLLKFGKLKSLTIEFASWNVVDLLPTWAERISRTLTTLTLYVRWLLSPILRSF